MTGQTMVVVLIFLAVWLLAKRNLQTPPLPKPVPPPLPMRPRPSGKAS